jgi:hypothetical protein
MLGSLHLLRYIVEQEPLAILVTYPFCEPASRHIRLEDDAAIGVPDISPVTDGHNRHDTAVIMGDTCFIPE